ncbi:SCRN3-like protein [Mya arenaria]|uniref:SCRN3-like protein n=1 Tax=Mya arenaria TaxID=6604 RepID=A0ABY7DBN9_MYAAR|nr:secernin-1-like [Mya arenaria]XP_052803069.1 secernin-1-like [Mya arenaria]WAQ94172.1 SCRN3-like protein [Mya arenaria]
MSDILVVLPPLTADGSVIFAKNSDRPPTEVQEVVYVPPASHEQGTKLHCTFIEVDQIPETRGVILSKPAWCWGAEMGANDRGVCIGNTAVWTRLCRPGDHEEKLIGMDLVRLGLERSSTAGEAIDVISGLLVTHGQGGICSEDHNFGQWTYHNSFVIADRQEAWLLETADKMWAAKKVTNGVLAVSSSLTIGTDADMTSLDLSSQAQNSGYWKADDGELNFAKAFSADYPGISLSEKQTPGHRLNFVQDSLHSVKEKININHVFKILRNEESSVNFVGELLTVGSQVSVLAPPTSNQPCCHWFTGTPNANVSIFKPFVFCDSPNIGRWTVSSTFSDTPRASFQTTIDRRHTLYRAHEKGRELMETGSPAGVQLHATLRRLEAQCVREVMEFVKTYRESDMSEVRDLFSDIAESEIKFYS